MSPSRFEWLRRSFRDQWWTRELNDLAIRAEAIGRLEEAYDRAVAREHEPPPVGLPVGRSSNSSVTMPVPGLDDDWREQHGLADVPQLTASFAFILIEELHRVIGD